MLKDMEMSGTCCGGMPRMSNRLACKDSFTAWRDPSLPPEKRAADLVQYLKLEEKAGLLMMQSPAIPRLDIAAYDWWNEALHGVGRNGIATVFPQAIALAATWNPELMRRIADVISTEARIKYHEALRENGGVSGRYQGITLWSPNVNLFRDPRWGRGQECYGEDVCLTAAMGTAFVRGLQGSDSAALKTSATPKHFAVHNGPECGRFTFNSIVSPRDLHEEELAVFELVVRDGRPASVMSAYNAINGVPCCVNHWLLTDLLRGEWGFEGAVVGDVDNVANLSEKMGVAADHAEGSAMALRAGQDLCSGWAFKELVRAVENGLVDEAVLDRALIRNLSVRFRLGQFDPAELCAYSSIPPSALDCAEHDALALEAARQSIVMLKNNGVLPLNLSRLRKVAVLGPTADSRAALLGNYAGEPSRPVSLLDGIRRKFEGAGVEVVHYRAVPLVKGMERQGYPLDAVPYLFKNEGCTAQGAEAQVYENPDFEGTPVPAHLGLNLFWNIYQPVPLVPAHDASIRWTAWLRPPVDGPYDFTVMLVGGIRLKVGETVVLDELSGEQVSQRRTRSGSVTLGAGQIVPVTVEFRQTCGEALLSVWWKSPLDPEDNLLSALNSARDADHIILCLGLTPEVEGEEMPVDFDGFKAGDRTTVMLPETQRALLAGAAQLNKPLSVVLTTGSAVALDASLPDAIVCAWYYGQRGGDAVAEVLAGEYNPAGRLPVTFYASDADLPPLEDYSMDGRTYKYFTGRPLYAFGHGLSYSTFAYGTPRMEAGTLPTGGVAVLRIPVSNTGLRDGDEVVQVYARNLAAGPDRPLRQLLGFTRQHLRAGETAEVPVQLDTRILRRRDASADHFVYDRGPWLLEAGPASDHLPVSLQMMIEG